MERPRRGWEIPGDHVVCMYKIIVTPNASVRGVASKVIRYASIGEKEARQKQEYERFNAEIISWYETSKRVGLVMISYPPEMFDAKYGGIASLLSVIPGWNVSMNEILRVKLLDVFLPEKITKEFEGPRWSPDKIRRKLRTGGEQNCFLRVPIYPRLAYPEDYEHRIKCLLKKAPEIAPDIIADSELLFNHEFCSIDKRIDIMSKFNKHVESMMDAKERVETKTGCKTLFFINVSGKPSYTLEKTEAVKEAGLDGITLNVLTTGFSLLEDLRSKFKNLIIYARANAHALLTRGNSVGISFDVLAKLFKIAGADIIYTGAPCGSLDRVKPLDDHVADIRRRNTIVRNPIYNIGPALPSISGGVHLGNLQVNILLAGVPLQITVGDGIYNFPWARNNLDRIADVIRLFKKAIYIITQKKENMWDDHELRELRHKRCRAYFMEERKCVDPTDKEIKDVLRRWVYPEFRSVLEKWERGK